MTLALLLFQLAQLYGLVQITDLRSNDRTDEDCLGHCVAVGLQGARLSIVESA